MVACDIRFTLGSVYNDCICHADGTLNLNVRREGRTAMTDHAGFPDDVDALIIGHRCEVIRMHRLMQTVFPIIFDNDGQNLTAIGVQTRLDRDDLTGNGCMNRRADKAARFCNHLSHIHDIALFHKRFCRCANVHGYRQDNLLGSGHRLDGLGVCCGFKSGVGMGTRMNTATKRVHH